MDEKIYTLLLKLANNAAKKKEVPVSALIVKDNKIIAKAYNKRQKTHNILNHAEIIAIIKASKKLKDWRLDNCDLYVTLKPCSMCNAIINQSRVRNVFYLLDKPLSKKEYNQTKYINKNISTLNTVYSKCLQDFFVKKRSKN